MSPPQPRPCPAHPVPSLPCSCDDDASKCVICSSDPTPLFLNAQTGACEACAAPNCSEWCVGGRAQRALWLARGRTALRGRAVNGPASVHGRCQPPARCLPPCPPAPRCRSDSDDHTKCADYGCAPGYAYSEASQACIKCAVEGCVACDGATPDACNADGCDAGKFYDGKACQPCSEGCESCARSRGGACDRCMDGYFMEAATRTCKEVSGGQGGGAMGGAAAAAGSVGGWCVCRRWQQRWGMCSSNWGNGFELKVTQTSLSCTPAVQCTAADANRGAC